MIMADIFLSYANRDADRIKLLVDIFERQGWSVWWDYKVRIGKAFEQVIEEEIAKAKCIVVLWSNESVKSDWVKSEADEGKTRHILAPVLIDNVAVPMGFRRIETAKLYDWKGGLDHPELKLLLHAVAEIIGQPPKQLHIEKTNGQSKRGFSFDFVKNRVRFAVSFTLLALIIGGGFIVSYFNFSNNSSSQSLSPARLEKVTSDLIIIPLSEYADPHRGYRNFAVRVVDKNGQPVPGAKVVWQTPDGGERVYVGTTDQQGITTATNIYKFDVAGTYRQTARIVTSDMPTGFGEHGKYLATIGEPITFTFLVQ
jgi:hypothetical protein